MTHVVIYRRLKSDMEVTEDMRKVIFGGANTLDNYIAGKDDSIDWIRHTAEVNDIMRDYWERIDTVILGRRTWEIAMKSGGGGWPEA